MGQYKSKSGKSKLPSHYYPPEILAAAICANCLSVVLENDKEAKEPFDEIVQCYDLPGWEEIFARLTEEIPEGESLLKKIVDKSGLDYNKPPDINNMGIPESRKLMKGGFKLINEYTEQYLPWVLEGKSRNRDVNLLLVKVINFIKIGFNNKKEQAKGKYKLNGSNQHFLCNAICGIALRKKYQLMLNEWTRLGVLKVGDRIYNINDIVNDKVTDRIHRNLTKLYKAAGYYKIKDESVDKMAYRWYQCRVVYSGPEEYSRKLQLDGQAGDPANLLNEIELCDIVLGYPRQTTKD
jgi:hypothetical protein